VVHYIRGKFLTQPAAGHGKKKDDFLSGSHLTSPAVSTSTVYSTHIVNSNHMLAPKLQAS